MRSRPTLDMTATVVSVAGPRDGSLVALLPGDHRRFASIAMAPAVAEGVVIGLLRHFHRFTPSTPIQAETARGPLAGVAVQQVTLAVDDAGGSVLTAGIGSLHLHLLLDSTALQALAQATQDVVRGRS